jgi:hypothetical protein
MDWSHLRPMDDVPDIPDTPQLTGDAPQHPHFPMPCSQGRPVIVTLCIWGMVVWTIFCVIGSSYGLANVSQMPKPTNEWQQTGQDLGLVVGMGVWAVMWFIPTVGLGVIALLAHALSTRRPS